MQSTCWADVQYAVNGGGQQNFRMRQDSGNNTYSAGGLKAGDVVKYSYTFWDTAKNYAIDSPLQSITIK